jgi:membrane associated rhomboid family serine protease
MAIVVTLQSWATLMGLMLVLIYTVKNGGWRHSPIGWSQVGFGATVMLLFGYSVLRRLFSWPVIPAVQIGIYALVIAMLTGLVVAWGRERRLWRSRQRNGEHDHESVG